MSIYLLIAGNLQTDAWNRLTGRSDYPPGGQLGGKVWNQVIPTLKIHHHSVFAPNLRDEKTHSLSDQVEEVLNLILQHDLQNIILVGASYCGMVITGVANKMPDRIKQLVYLDAVLPKSGQSVADIFKLAHFISKMPIEKSPTYTEKLYFNEDTLQSLPKLYVLCTESNFTSVTALAKMQVTAEAINWKYTELAASHLPMVTHPNQLNQLLLNIEKI